MRLILIYALFLIPAFLVGQHNRCLFDIELNTREDSIGYENFLSVVKYAKANPSISTRSIVYIPVVIHVVADESVQPVSSAQALQQLDVLNADFAGRGENISKLSDEFVSLIGNAEIQFCLATINPTGQPTSGITFTETDRNDIALQTEFEGRKAIHYDQWGGKSGWDPSRYINIWIGEYGDVLGSATFPGMSPFSEEIGVILDPKYFGSIGDAGHSGFFGGGHTLTHEMGHFFGLKHIWGNDTDNTCDDSDNIDDTPNAAGPYYDCPSGEQLSCGTSNMYQNFMDFTDDRCLAAFTHGQTLFMKAVLETYYPNLATETACLQTSESFDHWYDQLIWSNDPTSNTYVIYNPEIWMNTKDVLVYSVDGKLILEARWEEGWSYLLDLGHVASGIYIVSIADGDNRHVRKVIAF